MKKNKCRLIIKLLLIFAILNTSAALAGEPVIVTRLALPESSPGGVAVDGDHFWFVDMDTDQIIEIDHSGQQLSSFSSPGKYPKGLTFDGTNLWLSESSENKIYKLTTNGEVVDSIDSPANYPRGVAFDGIHLWHSDSDNAKIYKMDLTGMVLDVFDAPGPSPHGLAFDGHDLWIVDRELEKIFEISTTGTVLRSFDSPSESPYGLAFDGQFLWIIIRYGDNLYQLNIDHDLSDTPTLLTTKWNQREDFTLFTPDNYRAGCWSTAFAQILYYYRLQPHGRISYSTSTGYSLNEDFDAYPFDWTIFANEITDSTNEESINETAKYVYFTSVAIQKDFNTSNYVLSNSGRIAALESHYECDVTQFSLSSYSLEELKPIIIDEIKACRPVMLYMTHPEIGHATVIDGYEVIDGREYIHINMGSSGKNDGWYDINASTILDHYEIRYIYTLNPLYIDTSTEEFCNRNESNDSSLNDGNNQEHISVDGWKVAYQTNRSLDTAANLDFDRAVIVIHGTLRNADDYYTTIEDAAKDKSILGNTLIIAPQFKTEEDAPKADELYWSSSGWKIGFKSQNGNRIPSFRVIDEIIDKIEINFPNISFISIAGHSAGGQFIQRYAALNEKEDKLRQSLRLRYVVANPSSYMYLTSDRPASPSDCPDYDEYKYGIFNLPNTLAYTDLSKEDIKAQLLSRDVFILLGTEDNDPDSEYLDISCEANAQGSDRFDRGCEYFEHILKLDSNAGHIKLEVDGVGHSFSRIMEAEQGQMAVFDKDAHTNYKNYQDSNQLFDLAETIIPEILYPPNGETLTLNGINYRYYSSTNTYIGTLGRDFFLYGPLFDGMLSLGTINDYL